MDKKYTYSIFGIIVIIAIILVVMSMMSGKAQNVQVASKQGALAFSALKSSLTEAPMLMNSTDPTKPDQTDFSIASESYNARLSGDGSHIVFVTKAYGTATGLVPNPSASPKINYEQTYLRNLTTGAVSLISSTDGTIANAATWGQSSLPGISTTGQYVVFVASNLGLNTTQQVYLKDTVAGTLTMVSSADGVTGQAGNKFNPVVSADGKTVCWAGGPTLPDPNKTGVWCKSLVTNAVTLVAEAAGSSQGYAELSADGQYLTYYAGTNLGIKRVKLSDLSIDQVSDPASNAYKAKISADGNTVAWVDYGTGQVLVKNMETDVVTTASVNTLLQDADRAVYRAGISESGRYVVFSSEATNLINGVNSGMQTYVTDLLNLSAGPKLCSARNAANPAGSYNPEGYYGQGDQDMDGPTISNDGTICAFVASGDAGPLQLITNTSGNEWNYNVFVKGLGTAVSSPQIALSAQTLAISSTAKTVTTGQITVTNPGTNELTLSATMMDPSGKLLIVSSPSTVAAGASGVITVQFTPGPGKPNAQFAGTITITHNGSNTTSPMTVLVTGTRVK